jgi:hypothetical protein
MNGFQRLILAIVPRRLGQAIEKESRLWMLVCPDCGKETSFWDIGGIRYRAQAIRESCGAAQSAARNGIRW